MTVDTIELPKWFDLHTHFRQGANVAHYIADHIRMGCAGALAMPNTQPPVSRVSGPNQGDGWSIEAYQTMLCEAGADAFEQLIVPLYLTQATTAKDIETGAKSGWLKACKYYPPHGTTNSAHGVPMDHWIGSDVLKAMETNGIVLCIHGEQHALTGSDYFDSTENAETKFYQQWMPRLVETHPKLKIVCEHITTQNAVNFVQTAPTEMVGATITPQHLMYTVGHLVQGLRYHLYCLPLVKFEADRAALCEAITTPNQSQFFAGTDSAPHTNKMTDCGCAAGCYTGGIAPQLYAMAFEKAGADLSTASGLELLKKFLSTNGPAHYQFESSKQTFRLTRGTEVSEDLEVAEGSVTPLSKGLDVELTWVLG